jgi:NAD-dependent dihydropyrimidine dehydrogenase PreA subunit
LAFVITEACIGTKDRSCVDVCPVDCIHDEGDADQLLYIDPDECIDCGACEPACPVSAIFAEDDVPDNLKKFVSINATWYKDKDAARAQV